MTEKPVELSPNNMNDAELLDYLGTDATRWASVYIERYAHLANTKGEIDEGFIIAWFANAIQAGVDSVNRDKSELSVKSAPEPVSSYQSRLEALHLSAQVHSRLPSDTNNLLADAERIEQYLLGPKQDNSDSKE